MKKLLLSFVIFFLLLGSSFAQEKRTHGWPVRPEIKKGIRHPFEYGKESLFEEKNPLYATNDRTFLTEIQNKEEARIYAYLSQDFVDGNWVNYSRSLRAYEDSPPSIFSVPDMTIAPGASLSYTIIALGVPSLSYSLADAPTGMTIDDTNGAIQ